MIKEEIEKQINAGFSAAEIRTNLRQNGFTEEEIQQHTKVITAAPIAATNQRPGGWAIFVALLAIVRGAIWISNGQTGLGTVILCCGIVGIIAFIAQKA